MQDHSLSLELVKIFGSTLVTIIGGTFAILNSPKAQDFLIKNVFNKPLRNMGMALDAAVVTQAVSGTDVVFSRSSTIGPPHIPIFFNIKIIYRT